MSVTALACPDDLPEDLAGRLAARVEELRMQPLPLLDPDPAGEFVVASAMAPEHYEHAVSQGRRAGVRGQAREDRARAGGPRQRALAV